MREFLPGSKSATYDYGTQKPGYPGKISLFYLEVEAKVNKAFLNVSGTLVDENESQGWCENGLCQT